MKQKYLFNVFFLLFFTTIGWAQEIIVKGTVSSDEMPLPGAAVVVKGTTHGILEKRVLIYLEIMIKNVINALTIREFMKNTISMDLPEE